MSKQHKIIDYITRIDPTAAYDRTLCKIEVNRANNSGAKTEAGVTCQNCLKIMDKSNS